MNPHRSLFAVMAVFAATGVCPTSSRAECTGLAEVHGNDMVVSMAATDIQTGYYAHGNTLYAVWNESGTNPVPHVAGQHKWSWIAGSAAPQPGRRIAFDAPVTLGTGSQVIFVAADDGFLYKVNAQTGVTLASADTRRPTCPGDQIIATPAVQLFSLSNATFQAAAQAEGHGGDDLVIVITKNGCNDQTGNRVIAYWASNLSVKWTFNAGGTQSMGYGTEGCTIDYSSNRVYCGTTQTAAGQHTLWAIQTLPSSSTATLVWSTNAGSIKNRPTLNPTNPQLFVVNETGVILKVNPTDGSPVWAYPNPAPVIRNICAEFRSPLPTRIYYSTTDGHINGLVDGSPGPAQLWPPTAPAKAAGTAEINSHARNFEAWTEVALDAASGKLFVGRNDGYIQMVDAATATFEESLLVGTPETLLDPVLDRSSPGAQGFDRLLITTTEGSMKRYCIPPGSALSAPGPLAQADIALRQSAPNPFSTDTRIEYRLPQDANVEIDVFTVSGRRVRTLVRGQQPSGPHEAIWDGLDNAGRAVASGPYFYRLRVTGPDGHVFESSKKTFVVR